MDWIILSLVVIAIALFMSIKIVLIQPTFVSTKVSPPHIVYYRLNHLPEQSKEQVLNISKTLNFTVEELSNGNWTIYPKFNITTSTVLK